MQSSNHFEASPSPYTSVSTSDVGLGDDLDVTGRTPRAFRQDYGEAADRSLLSGSSPVR